MPDVYDNVIKIQRRNQLPVSFEEEVRRIVYCIEMETGTGKTYVYLRSIMELYTKLLSWFKIDTPLGSYNPD